MKKKIIALTVLASIAGFAVAASTRDADSAKPAAASPHGAMSVKPGSAASPHGTAPAIKPDAVMPPGHPAAIPADTNLANSGKVLEVIQSPDYTYLRVTGDKEPLWLASLKIDVAKGATVKYSSGVAMSKFYSKSLDRTFDSIVFVDSIAPEKK
ncbi:MAG TPA: hypothetical protein VMW07_00675 [Gallionella sp.]|nr:hypothetical protein [Gallionella sp.]